MKLSFEILGKAKGTSKGRGTMRDVGIYINTIYKNKELDILNCYFNL